ncbi:hypothetical protein LINGRAHAP2_LOCUS25282 [Linum grandiflorum]
MSDTPTVAVAAMQHQLDAMRLAEAKKKMVRFDPPEPVRIADYRLSIVVSLVITHPYNFNAMRNQMGTVWQPEPGSGTPRLWSDAIRVVPKGGKSLGGEAWLVETMTTCDDETATIKCQPRHIKACHRTCKCSSEPMHHTSSSPPQQMMLSHAFRSWKQKHLPYKRSKSGVERNKASHTIGQ